MDELDLKTLKIAIVHDILDSYGGAERVVEALLKIFPQADLYVSLFRPNAESRSIWQDRKINTTFLQKIPFAFKLKKFLTPFYPLAFESLDLTAYQIVISSTAHFAKDLITRPDQLHICYCHTPPRFLYGYPTETNARSGILKPILAVLDHKLRQQDFMASTRPDIFLANSQNTAKRIEKFYRRNAQVVYAPVEIEQFRPDKPIEKDNFYLIVSRLVAYKHIQTAVKAFNINGLPLIVIGDGPEKSNLMNLAKPNISFLGHINDANAITYRQRARGFILTTTDEDFGITAIEAIASGTPVIAYHGGGALETVEEGVTGLFYFENTPESLNGSLMTLEKNLASFNTGTLPSRVEKFGFDRFRNEMLKIVSENYPRREMNAASR